MKDEMFWVWWSNTILYVSQHQRSFRVPVFVSFDHYVDEKYLYRYLFFLMINISDHYEVCTTWGPGVYFDHCGWLRASDFFSCFRPKVPSDAKAAFNEFFETNYLGFRLQKETILFFRQTIQWGLHILQQQTVLKYSAIRYGKTIDVLSTT